MWKSFAVAFMVAVIVAGAAKAGDARRVERPDLARHFAAAGTVGTMVVHDLAKDVVFVVDGERAATGYLPASTFKIVNALAGLGLGVVREDETFASDGAAFRLGDKPLLPSACTGTLTLAAAFKLSCIPVYQEVARRVGAQRFRTLLERIGYGNGELASVPVDWFWLEGAFRVSALDQVRFLERLRTGDLPFPAAAMAAVREMMVVDGGGGTVIRAKTGYAYTSTPAVGWWVGWVETDGRAAVFALNLDVTSPDHLRARQAIAKAILRDLAIP